MNRSIPGSVVLFLAGSALVAFAQNASSGQEAIQLEPIEGASIYDHDPSTRLGDDIFGNIIADLENDAPGRCSHGGPVCLEYANGHIAAFYANTSDHNSDGWSEYALSKDRGRTWDRYKKFEYSHEAYKRDPKRPVIVEEGLTTRNGIVVLFLTHVDKGRSRSGFMRSRDHGVSWIEYEPLDGDFVGYPCAVGVTGDTNFVLYDISSGPHVLYVSTNDRKELDPEKHTAPGR